MARKVSRSRADQPQSNTALIVFLVFSILINLTVGVFLYLSIDKVDQAEKKANDAKAAADVAVKQREAVETFVTLLRSTIGDTTVDADKVNAMKGNLGAHKTTAGVEWFPDGKFWKELMGRGGNDKGLIGPFAVETAKPSISLIDKVRQLEGSLAETAKKLNDTTSARDKLNTEYVEYKKQWNAQNYEQQLKQNSDNYTKDMNDKLAKKDALIAEMRQKMTDLNNEMTKMMTDVTTAHKAREAATTARVDETIQKLVTEAQEEKDRKKREFITARNTPRARVVRFDATNNIAYVDIGSQMKVPLQLTFAIHGRDSAGAANPKPKAEGEVISVVGQQLSQVKIKRVARPDAERLNLDPETDAYWISDERQFVRAFDPVVQGDLCYNAVWKPFETVRVALVGEFDLDNNGSDDIQAFINLLRNQNAQIDMYLDKANGFQPRGKLDYTTDIVVVGGLPVLSSRGSANDPLSNKGTDLIRNAEKVQREAIEKGIEILTLPRFLSRIGFSTPRALNPRQADNSAIDRPPVPNPPPTEGGTEEKKPEDEKKAPEKK